MTQEKYVPKVGDLVYHRTLSDRGVVTGVYPDHTDTPDETEVHFSGCGEELLITTYLLEKI